MLYTMRYRGADDKFYYVAVRVVRDFGDGSYLVERQDKEHYGQHCLASWK